MLNMVMPGQPHVADLWRYADSGYRSALLAADVWWWRWKKFGKCRGNFLKFQSIIADNTGNTAMRSMLNFLMILVLMTFIIKANAQFKVRPATTAAEITAGINGLKASKSSRERLAALLKLSSAYLYKPGEAKIDIDSALLLAQQARTLSLHLKDDNAYPEAMRLMVVGYFEANDHEKMIYYCKELSGIGGIETLTYLGDMYFYKAYAYKPMNLVYLDTALIFYRHKLLLSKKLKIDKYIQQAVGHLEHLILICDEQKNTARLTEQTNWFKVNTRSLNIPFPSAIMSAKLGRRSVIEGNYDKALHHVLYALKLVNDSSPPEQRYWTYTEAGEVYRFPKKFDKSNIYYLKILAAPADLPHISMYSMAYFVVHNFRDLKQPDKALSYITDMQKRYAPRSDEDRHIKVQPLISLLSQFMRTLL